MRQAPPALDAVVVDQRRLGVVDHAGDGGAREDQVGPKRGIDVLGEPPHDACHVLHRIPREAWTTIGASAGAGGPLCTTCGFE